MTRWILALSILSEHGCKAHLEPTSSPSPTDDVPTGICGPLTIVPAEVQLEAGQSIRFEGQGGTGNYTFTLIGDVGGALDPDGRYTAPDIPTEDRVVLRDEGCPGSATARITTFPRLEVEPPSAIMPPGAVLEPAIEGGSGAWTCTLEAPDAGAHLDGCVYTAGSHAGMDRLLVTDTTTGAVRSVHIEVVPDAALVPPTGETRWFLPLGSAHQPGLLGGSGAPIFEVDGTAVAVDPVEPGRLLAEHPGEATITIRDRYIPSLQTSITATVVAPATPPLLHGGPSQVDAAIEVRDLDGDGTPEGVVGLGTVTADAPEGGWLAVLPGVDGGFANTPSWSLAGSEEGEALGASIALGDVDGDGRVDLLVGAPGAADGAGEIRLHLGRSDGRFEEAPSWTAVGGVAGDRLGRRVALCDLDGDGTLELIASGSLDPPGAPPNRGTIAIWSGGLGSWSGPTLRYGRAWRDDTFVDVPNLEAGAEGFAAGDHDGDGRCDVAVGAAIRDRRGDPGGGVVLLYAGRSDGSLLSEDPVAVIGGAPNAPSGMQFGHAIAMDDLNGDGHAELVIGARYADGSTTLGGAVWIYASGGAPPILELDQATAVLHGLHERGFLGSTLAIHGGSLWVGAPGIDTVYRFDGPLMGTTDASTAVALVGPEPGAGFGTVIGASPLLAVERYHTDEGAGRVEVPRLVAHDGIAPSPLLVPGQAALAGVGTAAVELGDVLVVGAPDAADPEAGAGAGRLHLLQDDGSWSTLDARAPSQGRGDRLGALLARGDFDGDGAVDLAVAAPMDGRPATVEPYVPCGTGPVPRGGSVSIHLAATGLGGAPDFIVYGDRPGETITALLGGFDHDGDGRDDLVIGFGGDPGRVALVRGRPFDGPAELCPDVTHLGPGGAGFGRSLAVVGDLDCDAVAVGAPLADPALMNEGLITILWGYGPGCATTEPLISRLRTGVASGQAGTSLAGGFDLTGDGTTDLVVGGPTRAQGGTQTGAVWLVDGTWLATMERSADPSPTILPDAPVYGPPGTGFGASVALGTVAGRPSLAVGMPEGGGGLLLYELHGTVLKPWARMLGESGSYGGALGATLVPVTEGLAVGAPRSDSGDGRTNGAIYRLP